MKNNLLLLVEKLWLQLLQKRFKILKDFVHLVSTPTTWWVFQGLKEAPQRWDKAAWIETSKDKSDPGALTHSPPQTKKLMFFQSLKPQKAHEGLLLGVMRRVAQHN